MADIRMDLDGDSTDIYLHEDNSPNGERISGVTAGEALIRIELKSAYSSEKLLNLEILFMQVEDIVADYEGLTISKDNITEDSAERSFQVDMLMGILNSEIKELDSFMGSLQLEISDAFQKLSVGDYNSESSVEMEKLRNAAESLKQSQDHIADMRVQSAKFEKLLAFVLQKNCSGTDEEIETGQLSPVDSKWKLQNVEQQRKVLQLLEKSLARELDLEKKLTDSKNSEQQLRIKLKYAEREMYYMEESMDVIWERLFGAENAVEVLLGISKELTGKFQIVQFNLNSTFKRESEMRSKLEECMRQTDRKQILAGSEEANLKEKVKSLEEKLRAIEIELRLTKASAETSDQQQKMLHSEVSEKDHVIQNLKENLLKAETRAQTAEAKYEMLTKTNMELETELGALRSSGAEMASDLERKLKESDTQLEHAKASFEAIEEQQNMLYSTLSDMGNLIENLKGKVLKAETRAESAESKCSLLTETNLELNEELVFLRGRVECLEASLNQADEAKMATAKDIGIRTKIIAHLVSKLALERQRLQLEIAELTKKNKILVSQCMKVKSSPQPFMTDEQLHSHDESKLPLSPEEASTEFWSTNFQVEKSHASVVTNEMGTEETLIEDTAAEASKLEMVRSIEARQLGGKYLFLSILILFAALITSHLLLQEG